MPKKHSSPLRYKCLVYDGSHLLIEHMGSRCTPLPLYSSFSAIFSSLVEDCGTDHDDPRPTSNEIDRTSFDCTQASYPSSLPSARAAQLGAFFFFGKSRFIVLRHAPILHFRQRVVLTTSNDLPLCACAPTGNALPLPLLHVVGRR